MEDCKWTSFLLTACCQRCSNRRSCYGNETSYSCRLLGQVSSSFTVPFPVTCHYSHPHTLTPSHPGTDGGHVEHPIQPRKSPTFSSLHAPSHPQPPSSPSPSSSSSSPTSAGGEQQEEAAEPLPLIR